MPKQNQIIIQDMTRMRLAIKSQPAMAFAAYKTAVKLSAQLIKVAMKHEVPKATRNLARSIQSQTKGMSATIGPDIRTAPYAIFVHEGTRAHEIRPTKKKALYWKGARHPVKVVHHPGTRANRFIDKTVDESEPKVNKVFQLTTAKLLKSFTKISG